MALWSTVHPTNTTSWPLKGFLDNNINLCKAPLLNMFLCMFLHDSSFSSDLTNSFSRCYIKMSENQTWASSPDIHDRPHQGGWERTNIPACGAPGGAGLKRPGPIHKVSFKQSACANQDWHEERRQLVFTHTVSLVCPTEGHYADAELGKYTESDHRSGICCVLIGVCACMHTLQSRHNSVSVKVN